MQQVVEKVNVQELEVQMKVQVDQVQLANEVAGHPTHHLLPPALAGLLPQEWIALSS